MVWLRGVTLGVAVAVAMATWTTAEGAAPSGTAIAVVQSAQVDGQTGQILLQPEAPVFSGDHIITGAAGEVQVKFRDDTKLVIGPNSMLVIDAFVFSDSSSARKISIDAIRGAFRFITGNSPKDAYSINTPTATIGVRGTAFDFDVDRASGTLRLANFEGATRICYPRVTTGGGTKSEHCVITQGSCGVSVLAPNQDLKSIRTTATRDQLLSDYFRYVGDQSGLRADFRLDLSGCGLPASIVAPQPSSHGLPPIISPD